MLFVFVLLLNNCKSRNRIKEFDYGHCFLYGGRALIAAKLHINYQESGHSFRSGWLRVDEEIQENCNHPLT